MSDKNLIISIDIALNTSGVSVVDYEKNVYLTTLLEVKKSLKYYDKLVLIYDALTSLFEEIIAHNPKSVDLILEGRLKAGWSGSTLASIEGARVTAYHAFRQTCLLRPELPNKVFLYDPGMIKQYFTKKRTAAKDLVFKGAVKGNPFLKKYKQEDILDSLYLSVYHVDTR